VGIGVRRKSVSGNYFTILQTAIARAASWGKRFRTLASDKEFVTVGHRDHVETLPSARVTRDLGSPRSQLHFVFDSRDHTRFDMLAHSLHERECVVGLIGE
jgi:hypothetical protein